MRRVGQVRKRDANEGAIVAALEGVGAHVTRISGKGAPDILVRYGGKLWAFEVKRRGGKRTKAQAQTQWPIIVDHVDAFIQLGII